MRHNMRKYFKVQTPCERGIKSLSDVYGNAPRYFWKYEDAQLRCDDLNLAHTSDPWLAGTFSVKDRCEDNGVFDDADAKEVLK